CPRAWRLIWPSTHEHGSRSTRDTPGTTPASRTISSIAGCTTGTTCPASCSTGPGPPPRARDDPPGDSHHVRGEGMKIGNRVPETYFETTGSGESDVTIHAGSYHLALREAGIEMANIMTYSSILPATARRIAYPGRDAFTHGE